MLKNLITYSIAAGWGLALEDAQAAVAKHPFMECSATQAASFGWVPPRGETNGALIESVAGCWVMRFMSEKKVVPGNVLKRRVKEKAERIEKETGRKPGKKESRDLRDEALLDLLPMAFPKQVATQLYIDHDGGYLLIDATSQAMADEIVSLLIESLPPGLTVGLLGTETSPTAAMAHWLNTQEPPPQFTIDRECELQSDDEAKATVKYARHPLDIAEVQAHIAAGKLPTNLALTWDDRVSFVLTESLALKKIKLLDTVFEGTAKSPDADSFDADWTIFTGEVGNLLPALTEALGGESKGVGA